MIILDLPNRENPTEPEQILIRPRIACVFIKMGPMHDTSEKLVVYSWIITVPVLLDTVLLDTVLLEMPV